MVLSLYLFGSSITQRGTERLFSQSSASHSRDQILVLGGNGYVGSYICKEALRQGFSVSSLSRSGRSSLNDSWVNDVTWHQGDLLSPDSLKPALEGTTSVIS